MRVSSIILTLGDRPDDLAVAIASAQRQRDVAHETIVVWNGAEATALDGVEAVVVETNSGIPGGRNLGAAAADGELLFFLDDDAEICADDVFARLVEQFAADPALAVVGLRIVDEGGETASRHVPRIGGRGASEPGEVTAFLGGAACIRAEAFHQVGGYSSEFVYSMEETDLSWRLLDRGWSIRYEPDLSVFHPRTTPARHADAARRTARNRVWLARRRLPLPLAITYLMVWLTIGAARDPRSLSSVLAGAREGFSQRTGARTPISWRTALRMTRLGRPPVV